MAESICCECGKTIKRFPATCPACKTIRCWKCWNDHLDRKECAYGKATTLGVQLPPMRGGAA